MHVLVTAGPTREFMDPVRFISNRSSGKMGYAIAAAARDRGHSVVLVTGPVALPAPAGVILVPVVTAAEMLAAVESRLNEADALIMAAAPADWRPVAVAPQKLKKTSATPELKLEPTPDILRTIAPRKAGRVFVGFAAETIRVEEEARRKLADKGLDLIVANDVSQSDAGFDVDTNRVVLLTPDAPAQALPLMSKRAVGERIMEWVEGEVLPSHHGKLMAGACRVTPHCGSREVRPPGGNARIDVEENEACRAEGRLARQWEFIREIDKLKSVYRQTLLRDGSRYENDAEHSWHLAVMAVLLKEHANDPTLDLSKVIAMVLIHDIVEIDAGDTYCYDDKGNVDKPAREQAAATRLFGLLPEDQQQAFRALWEEFEARESAEAKFAAALDRVQPLMHNYDTGGVIWRKHGVRSDKVRERNRHVEEGSSELWRMAEGMIRDAVDRGFLEA